MSLSSIFFIQLVVIVLFSLSASFFDVKYNRIPDMLNYILIAFGLLSNLILSLISGNLKFVFASLISMLITYVITSLLWELNMWGGGDVKLFTGIASVMPSGLNIDFLNIFPKLSVYPFALSVVVNSILISFPFLVLFLIHIIIKNKIFKNNIDFIANILNIKSLRFLITSTLNKRVKIQDLKEGNIINNYYFDDEKIIDLINQVDGNLKVYKNSEEDNLKYYFKSLSAGGITKGDMNLLKIMNAQKIISDEISIKISYPFTPAIFVGLIIAIFYGDVMMLFAKSLVGGI